MNQQTHLFCTSVQCAASLIAMGAELRKIDPMTVTVSKDGEDVKFWFESQGKYGQTKWLMDAYNWLARSPETRRTIILMPESNKIVHDLDHPAHACYQAMNARYHLHNLLNQVMAGSPYDTLPTDVDVIDTSNINLAATLHALGHKVRSIVGNKRYTFMMQWTERAEIDFDAFTSAWEVMKLPADHKLYFMKSALEHRGRLLDLKKNAPRMALIKDGTKTGIFPIDCDPEKIKALFKHANK